MIRFKSCLLTLLLCLLFAGSSMAESLGRVNFGTSPLITSAVTVLAGQTVGASPALVTLGKGATVVGVYPTSNQDQLIDSVALSVLAPTITAATLSTTDPVSLTMTAHGLATGDRVWIAGVVGTVELNSKLWQVTVVDANTVTLVGTSSADFTAYTSGGTATSEKGILTVTLAAAATANNVFNVVTFKTQW